MPRALKHVDARLARETQVRRDDAARARVGRDGLIGAQHLPGRVADHGVESGILQRSAGEVREDFGKLQRPVEECALGGDRPRGVEPGACEVGGERGWPARELVGERRTRRCPVSATCRARTMPRTTGRRWRAIARGARRARPADRADAPCLARPRRCRRGPAPCARVAPASRRARWRIRWCPGGGDASMPARPCGGRRQMSLSEAPTRLSPARRRRSRKVERFVRREGGELQGGA
jgi:hypothetical protein